MKDVKNVKFYDPTDTLTYTGSFPKYPNKDHSTCNANDVLKGTKYEKNRGSLGNSFISDESPYIRQENLLTITDSSYKINAFDTNALVHMLDYVLRFWQFGSLVNINTFSRYFSHDTSSSKIRANSGAWRNVRNIIDSFKDFYDKLNDGTIGDKKGNYNTVKNSIQMVNDIQLGPDGEANEEDAKEGIQKGAIISKDTYNEVVEIYFTMRNTCKCNSDCGSNCEGVYWCNPDCGCHYVSE